MKLDILAIGVHPDDVELGCSGVLINEIQRGKKAGILDLTRGELGTRGSIETRYAEAAKAAMIMGVTIRENLKMRDGFFQNDEAHQMLLVKALRKYRPEIVFANAPKDRHPDHGRAAKLISDACFLSGLGKIETIDEHGNAQQKWRPKYVLNYIQDRYIEPDVVIDITDVFEKRMQSIAAYGTQFYNPADDSNDPQSYISSPDFYDSVIARARMMGKKIGVKYGEGFTSDKTIGIKSTDALILIET
jgi:N-acetylglucosamine malate deacetylase 1